MHVHEIGEIAFEKYAIDLLSRLDKAEPHRPTVWVSVGASGKHVAQQILKVKHDWPWLQGVKVAPLACDPTSGAYHFETPSDATLIENATVLMIDSVVNSGTTMNAALALLRSTFSAVQVLSYATAVRVTASFVPNVFSVLIGPNDRIFLPWHKARPNNRMAMRGVFRDLSELDLKQPSITSSQEFMNRVTWKDRWYTMKAEPLRRVIVCDIGGKIVSFVNFTIDPDASDVHIDEVATDTAYEGNGFAGALLRFTETFGRAMGCRKMSLWAHADVVSMYEKMSYTKSGSSIECDSDGTFTAMARPLGSSKQALSNWQRSNS